MKLTIRALHLLIETPKGPFGARLQFSSGLCVIRAENTSGKSTCIQAIIYAMGLEGMLGASHDVPLPHVMTDKLEHNNETLPVSESRVRLEIQNENGRILTIERTIKGKDDRRLVKTWEGAALTEEKVLQRKDYYVRMPDAATAESGFHKFLAEFLGWKLPQVPRYNGPDCPLYAETIFPLMIVEQKHGWSDLQARMPTHYGIRDMGKRAIEFILGLDAYEIILKRQKLQREIEQVGLQWQSLLAKVTNISESIGASLYDFPSLPVISWDGRIPHVLMLVSTKWITIVDYLSLLRKELSELTSAEIPKINEVEQAASQELESLQDALVESEMLCNSIGNAIDLERSSLQNVSERITTLQEDLAQYEDVRRLNKLGSIQKLSSTLGNCPTCTQPLKDILLISSSTPMTLDENISFIKDQINAFSAMKLNVEKIVSMRLLELRAGQAQAVEKRARIRSLKRTLVSDDRLPSIEALEKQIRLEQKIKTLDSASEKVRDIVSEFELVSKNWKALHDQRNSLPKENLSAEDNKKLLLLRDCVVSQLKVYGLKSVPAEQIEISRENYKPIHEGFDLGFDLSASDNIRKIWAYLHGLLEVARSTTTNHLGLLIFDEPGQQQMREASLAALLRRSATAGSYGQQVIFATSQKKEFIEPILNDLPSCSYQNFDSFIIAPLN